MTQDIKIAKVLRRGAEPRLGGYPNVIGIGIGFTEKGGRLTRDICIQVFVHRKLQVKELTPGELIPPRFRSGDYEVGTDVIAIQPALATLPDNETRLVVSGGNQLWSPGGTGTLGGFAWDPSSRSVVGLTANHVVTERGSRATIPADPFVEVPARRGQHATRFGDVAAVSRIVPRCTACVDGRTTRPRQPIPPPGRAKEEGAAASLRGVRVG